MKRTTPPFRADHVGSLLRPQALKDARAKRVKGEISAADLKAIEDREIERVIKKQEDIGLQVATDGEFRRSWWQFDFYAGLAGVELYSTPGGIKFHGVETKAESVRVVGKIDFSSHPMLDHFRFLMDHTLVVPKMTIPAPGTLHFRQGRQSISKDIYPDLDAYFDDVVNPYPKPVHPSSHPPFPYLHLHPPTRPMLSS